MSQVTPQKGLNAPCLTRQELNMNANNYTQKVLDALQNRVQEVAAPHHHRKRHCHACVSSRLGPPLRMSLTDAQ